MTRVIRLIIPVSLCGLFTSAAVLACHHHHDGPATAQPATPATDHQPAPTTPPGEQPTPTMPPGGPGPGMLDAGMTGSPPPSGPQATLQRSLNAAGVPAVQLASQPAAPPGPTGAPPTPGAPAPNPPTPSPNAPSPTPTPGSPSPGTPPAPSVPPSPTGPSQPGGPTPAPGTPQTPGPPPQTPSDAGIGDALTPPVPPISDSGVRIDSGMSPVLQRDSSRVR